MKNIRTLLIAVSALVILNVAQAQTPVSTDTSAPVNAPAVTSTSNAPYSADPYVQKRQADSVAKKEYKARKKSAKKQLKTEKKEAKSELKAERSEATDIRNKALAVEPSSK